MPGWPGTDSAASVYTHLSVETITLSQLEALQMVPMVMAHPEPSCLLMTTRSLIANGGSD